MVSKYTENGGDILPQFIHEKETICDQHEPSRVFGTVFKFLKEKMWETQEENNSCVWRECAGSLCWNFGRNSL